MSLEKINRRLHLNCHKFCMCLLNWQPSSLCVMWWISWRVFFFFGVQRKHNKKFGWFCFYPPSGIDRQGWHILAEHLLCYLEDLSTFGCWGRIFGCSYSACDLSYLLSVLIDIKHKLTLSKDIKSHKRTEKHFGKGMQQLFCTETNIRSSWSNLKCK